MCLTNYSKLMSPTLAMDQSKHLAMPTFSNPSAMFPEGVDQGADEVVVVIALEDDLHVPLEQARL